MTGRCRKEVRFDTWKEREKNGKEGIVMYGEMGSIDPDWK